MHIFHLAVAPLFAIIRPCAASVSSVAFSPRSSGCEPFYTTFNFPSYRISNSISQTGPYSPSSSLVAISPPGSYRTTHSGLELYLNKPGGKITTTQGVNDKIAHGATINSTFTLLYGKVTFEVTAPTVAGIITAVILMADQGDEIDIELLGGDPTQWQTNMFAPSPQDLQPLFGVFGSVEKVPSPNPTIAMAHAYTIDWNKDRIKWSIDGNTVRTLKKENAVNNGVLRYPSHPSRIQLGIWDASSDVGTSQWGRGPVNWNDAPHSMKTVVKSVRVECN